MAQSLSFRNKLHKICAAGILKNIQKLNINWCKAIAYKTGKLGGWVSENYLAMARLNKWFYSGIEIITSDESVRDLGAMLNIPQDRWLKSSIYSNIYNMIHILL